MQRRFEAELMLGGRNCAWRNQRALIVILASACLKQLVFGQAWRNSIGGAQHVINRGVIDNRMAGVLSVCASVLVISARRKASWREAYIEMPKINNVVTCRAVAAIMSRVAWCKWRALCRNERRAWW